MDPLITALAPSLSDSLAKGASGYLQGQMEGEDRLLKNQLTQAQIDWQRAHAAGYQHQQKTSMEALRQLQEGMAKDPNFLRSDLGRMLAYTAGRFDIMTQDASAGASNALGAARQEHGGLWSAQHQTEEQLRDPRERTLNAQGYMREQLGNQYEKTTPGKVDLLGSQRKLNEARGVSEGALANMRNWRAQLDKQRIESEKARAAHLKANGGHALNLYSMAEMYHQRVTDALDAQMAGEGPGPDPNDIIMLDDLRTKLRGPEYSALPLGSPGVFNKSTGVTPQPEVPEKRSMFGLGSPIPGSGIPATPPEKKPLDLAPRRKMATTPVRPGIVEQDQSALKAQKLIKEKGIKFASDQLKSNTALTPTEKLALQQALEKAMATNSLEALP